MAPGGRAVHIPVLCLWIHWAEFLERNPRDGSWVACGENIDLGQGWRRRKGQGWRRHLVSLRPVPVPWGGRFDGWIFFLDGGVHEIRGKGGSYIPDIVHNLLVFIFLIDDRASVSLLRFELPEGGNADLSKVFVNSPD